MLAIWHPSFGWSRSLPTKIQCESRASESTCSHARAKSSHSRKSPPGTLETPNQAFQVGAHHATETGSQAGANLAVSAFPAWYSSTGCLPSSGCGHQMKQYQPTASAKIRSGRIITSALPDINDGPIESARIKCGFIALARNSTTGTTTALPN